MDTHSRRTNNNGQVRNGQQPRRRMTAKQRAAKKRRKMIIFAIEIVVILLMLGLLYVLFVSTNKGGPSVVEIPEEKLAIDQSVADNVQMQGYWNIAFFGVDATNESGLIKGSNSDSIMIASINMDTGDIRLASVYRDTYLNIGKDKYTKCNAAYARGGGEQALKMLNTNLDMDIVDFITVGYEGVKTVVDGLGGVYIDVDSEELKHINNYQIDIAKTLGLGEKGYKKVTDTGYQLLDGMQATAYCRIRYTKGNDFARAERQREVLKAIEEQAKKASLATLTEVFNDAMEHVYTTLRPEDLLPLLSKINNYKIIEEAGFPDMSMIDTGNIGSNGSCVIPIDLEKNVVWLHEFLFEDIGYQVSDRVVEYSAKIKQDTTPYLDSRQ